MGRSSRRAPLPPDAPTTDEPLRRRPQPAAAHRGLPPRAARARGRARVHAQAARSSCSTARARRAVARRSTTTRARRRRSRPTKASCRSRASTRSTRSRSSRRARPSTGAGRSSRRRSTSRSARPGCRSAKRSAASRSRSGSSSRRAPRTCPGWLELYPDLRFKLDPDRDWTDDVIATLRNVETDRLQGHLPRRVRRAARRGALRARRGGVPGRVDRGPGTDAGDDARARAATATGSPGTRRSTSGATSKRCRSRRSA